MDCSSASNTRHYPPLQFLPCSTDDPLFVGDRRKGLYKWYQHRATILHFICITQLYFAFTFQLLSQHLWRKGNVWMICGGTKCALNSYMGFQ